LLATGTPCTAKGKVLEVGVGHGEKLSLLSQVVVDVTGLDIADKNAVSCAIAVPKSLVPRHSFMEGDVQSLPFPENSLTRPSRLSCSAPCPTGSGVERIEDACVRSSGEILLLEHVRIG